MAVDIDNLLGNNTPEITKGRPGARRQNLGPLYSIMMKAFPRCIDHEGMLDIAKVAAAIGMTKQAVYKWFQAERIPANRAYKIVTDSNGRVTHEDFARFIV